jgi:hypothetical protein
VGEMSPLVVSLPPLHPKKLQKQFSLLHPDAPPLLLPPSHYQFQQHQQQQQQQQRHQGDIFLLSDPSSSYSYQRGSVVSDFGDVDDNSIMANSIRDSEQDGHNAQQHQHHPLDDDHDDNNSNIITVPLRKMASFSTASSSRSKRCSSRTRLCLVWTLVATVTICGLVGASSYWQWQDFWGRTTTSTGGRYNDKIDLNDNRSRKDTTRTTTTRGSRLDDGPSSKHSSSVEHHSSLRLRERIPIPLDNKEDDDDDDYNDDYYDDDFWGKHHRISSTHTSHSTGKASELIKI